MGNQTAQRALSALAQADAGDFGSVEALLLGWSTSSEPEIAAWCLSLSATAWLAGLEQPAPGAARVRALVGASPQVKSALLHAAWVVARRQILSFDGEGLATAVDLYQQLTIGHQTGTAELGSHLLGVWVAVGQGSAVDLDDLQHLESTATGLGMAGATVEAAVLRALVAEQRGELHDALATARRAMRMAQTEGLPQPEHLAALVLARIRRRLNQPHLAARILGSLRRYAAPAWHDWIDWELAQTSGAAAEPTDEPPESHRTRLPSTFRRWLGAAAAGDRSGFDAMTAELSSRLQRWAPTATDLRRAHLAIDAWADASGLPDIQDWRRHRNHELPLGIAGLGSGNADEAPPFAWVIADPSWEHGVRVLGPGAGLARQSSALPRTMASGPSRPHALNAVLALAGPAGLAEADAFAQTYDFAFRPELHRNVFNVAIHRARALLDGIGEILRDGDRLRLRIEACSAFPDPRSMLRLTDRVLHCVAVEGQIQAREIAKALGVSVRSAQSALEELLDDGACERQKVGRKVQYVLEDTTYSEPTQHRGRPAG